jgi:hypothetical protein
MAQPTPQWWREHWSDEEAEEADPVELRAYLLRGRLNILEMMCVELGTLDQFKRALKRAREEKDPLKLPTRVNVIEKEVLKCWNEANPAEQIKPMEPSATPEPGR